MPIDLKFLTPEVVEELIGLGFVLVVDEDEKIVHIDIK